MTLVYTVELPVFSDVGVMNERHSVAHQPFFDFCMCEFGTGVVRLNYVDRLAVKACGKHFTEPLHLWVGDDRHVPFHLLDGLCPGLGAPLATSEGVADLMAVVALSDEWRAIF